MNLQLSNSLYLNLVTITHSAGADYLKADYNCSTYWALRKIVGQLFSRHTEIRMIFIQVNLIEDSHQTMDALRMRLQTQCLFH